MSQKALMIVPGSSDPPSETNLPTASFTPTGSCSIKIASAEVTFQNGVEARLIQIVIRGAD
ncbi:hypothetical protein QT711_06005 [Sporosarcina saromensis]|uniref:Uncharacterized protein n=1 Tax=Sporosarcina saromensis TaxID=359365 RepID=A0ABU4G6W9_9BACL|nr:hypothetical protein [Sporosarcina saromensis]MDW0112731.1 hypothetical protein [Sporosarcina saromensis]